MLLVSTQAQAQVAISVGIQELYDDNVYLEDDSRSLPPELSDPNNLPEGTTADSLEPIDGDKNSDFITVPSVSIATALPTGQNIDSALEASLAALIFADRTDESRLAIDSHLTFASSETLLPEPFSVRLSSVLNSQSSDISVAEGSPARQSQSHTANLTLGVTDWGFGKNWYLSSNYGLTRYDYLEEFTFDDREDRPFEERGSDYFKNGIGLQLRNEVSKRLTAGLNSNVDYTSFSETDSNDEVVDQRKTSTELDTGLGFQ
jgi:hypothetical protein